MGLATSSRMAFSSSPSAGGSARATPVKLPFGKAKVASAALTTNNAVNRMGRNMTWSSKKPFVVSRLLSLMDFPFQQFGRLCAETLQFGRPRRVPVDPNAGFVEPCESLAPLVELPVGHGKKNQVVAVVA